MARYKVPSQAASGADSFSDDLVGNQITQGSPLMTGTNFAIENAIPEKDSKQFITQPFSNFLTWDDIEKETASTTSSGTISAPTASNVIKFNNDKENADRSLYGSLKQRLGVSVTNIITKYPAAIMTDASSPVGLNSYTAENVSFDILTNTTEFQVQYSTLYNPFDIVLKTPQSSIIPETDNSIRNFYSSFTKYAIDLSGTTFNIINYIEPNSVNKITLKVEGNCFAGYTAYTQNYLIRPNDGIVENFYIELDDLERALLNRDTNPIFNAGFNIPRDTRGGYATETVTEYVNWPLSRDGWNIQIIGLDYDFYVDRLSSLGDEIDGYKSNLIVRFLTSPQLYEFDTEEKKIEAIFQIYGQSFDQVKKFIDNIAYMRNVTYDSINNVPDILLKNLAETLGLSTVSLFDEKSLQDSLYTRHDLGYDGVSTGTNLIEAEHEFYRRLLVNLAWLYKSKGTRTAIEFFLKFIGAPEPMIRLDEYVYKVDGPLPSSNAESDIQDVILGYKTFNVAKYPYDAISITDNHTDYNLQKEGFTFLYVTSGATIDPADWVLSPLTGTLYEKTSNVGSWRSIAYDSSMSGYTLTQITGSTDLTRAEYPVDEETGLPRGIEYSDGSMFFQKGAGWYRKTLDHRSPDIIDEANSDLTSRVKVIKTMAKPFTYGEDYFNVYRSLPGLGYGFTLSSEIDNEKTEVVDDEYTSKLTLNRKNINVFLSADRAIDYDIYRKSRDLLIDFGTVTPSMTSGITFAEFLDDIVSNVITNSHVIRYKPFYIDLLTVYNEYQSSQLFTPYHYISVNDFINRLSPYWVNIIEQFIPATTLWTGGNVIENGLFNRSKLKHRQPCVPLTYTETVFPDFQTVIEEDIETIIGSGSIDGIDAALQNFRGLQLFNGVTFDVILEVNGIVYSGATFNLQPFTGFTVTSDCTILETTTESIPLICGYSDNIFNGGDNVDDIKEEWKTALNNLVDYINTIYTGETGFYVTVEYFIDVDRSEPPPRTPIEYVRFTIVYNEYYGCSGNETFDYYFKPTYNLEKEECDLQVSVATTYDNVFSGPTDCLLVADLDFTINNAVGDEMGNWPIYIHTGCTTNANLSPIEHISGCQFRIPGVREFDKFGMLFTDAANCEQKIKVDGLQFVIVEYSSLSGFTAVPKVEYRPTYNYGLPRGTIVYRLNSVDETPPATYADVLTGITSGHLIETPVENLVTGNTILSIELKPYNELTSSQFINAGTTGYQFAFNYVYRKVRASDCLSTTKVVIVNNEYEILPTSKVLVYTNIDVNLQTIPYHFDYKYPEDLFARDGNYHGDYMIDYTGFPIEVSGVTLNYCDYDKTYYQINLSGSTGTNVLLNGFSGSTYNKLIISFREEVIDPLTFDLNQYFLAPGYDESSPINATRPVYGSICTDEIVLPTPTPTRSITPSVTPTISVSQTIAPSVSISPSRTVTPTPTPSITSTHYPTLTPSITLSPSNTPTPSSTPSSTPSTSITPSSTPTPTPSSSIFSESPENITIEIANYIDDSFYFITGMTVGFPAVSGYTFVSPNSIGPGELTGVTRTFYGIPTVYTTTVQLVAQYGYTSPCYVVITDSYGTTWTHSIASSGDSFAFAAYGLRYDGSQTFYVEAFSGNPPSPTPSTSVTPSLTVTPGLSPTVTPSITPTAPEVRYGYLIDSYNCAFPLCEGVASQDIGISNSTPLSVDSYYLVDSSTVYHIKNAGDYGGSNTDVSGTAYASCNNACADQ